MMFKTKNNSSGNALVTFLLNTELSQENQGNCWNRETYHFYGVFFGGGGVTCIYCISVREIVLSSPYKNHLFLLGNSYSYLTNIYIVYCALYQIWSIIPNQFIENIWKRGGRLFEAGERRKLQVRVKHECFKFRIKASLSKISKKVRSKVVLVVI